MLSILELRLEQHIFELAIAVLIKGIRIVQVVLKLYVGTANADRVDHVVDSLADALKVMSLIHEGLAIALRVLLHSDH